MSASKEAAQGWVALVGAGPGDEGLLTVRAAELLGQASLVVAGAGLELVARRHMSQDAVLADPADGAGSARALVQAAVMSPDGSRMLRAHGGAPAAGAWQLGRDLAAELLRSGASDLISVSEGQANTGNDVQ